MVKPTFQKEKKKKEVTHKKTQKERYELKLKYKKDFCTCGNVALNNSHCSQHPTLTTFFKNFQKTKKVEKVPSEYESI